MSTDEDNVSGASGFGWCCSRSVYVGAAVKAVGREEDASPLTSWVEVQSGRRQR